MLNNTVDRYFTQEQRLILIFPAESRAQSTTVLKLRFRATREKAVGSRRFTSDSGNDFTNGQETKRNKSILPEGQTPLTQPEAERSR